MTMNPRAWIATAAVMIATSSVSYAETKNEIRTVSFTEDSGITRVHVRGAQTPTFTVYKLERPTRVVVDLPQSRLGEALRGHEGGALFSPNTWGVSTIAAQQLDDGAVRVIVTMARPGRYDVKTDGNEVVVMVMPRDPAPKTPNPAELELAKRQAQAAEEARKAAEKSSEVANATAKQSKAEAETAKAEAERLRTAAAQQAAKAEAAQRAVDEAKQAAAKNAANAADVERAKRLAAAANDEAARAKAQAAKASTEAEQARASAQLAQIEADKVKIAAEQARRDALAEAAAAKADAKKARDEMARAKTEVARAQAEAQAQVAKSQAEVAKSHAEAEAKLARTKAEADRLAKSQADAQAQLARSQAELVQSRAEADAARREAQATRAQLETQMSAARSSEAKARAAVAAAQAREDAAREAATKAKQEKELAEAVAKRAQQARDSADAASKDKLVAEAKAAEARLAKARQATAEAEIRRQTAEQLATAARQDLDHSRTALQSVEQQRATAIAAARSADEQRAVAEAAARAADKQRTVAEAATRDAMNAKRDAEASLAQLTKKREAAERAAQDVAARTKAEAAAQAEMDSARSRKASADEIAAARREVARLADERKRAETELSERRKAVAQQQAEAARLESQAQAAREAASREDARRTQLAQQREAEERELTKLKAQKATVAAEARDAEERELAKLEAKRVQAQLAQTPQRSTPAPKPATPAPAKVNNVTFKGNDTSGTVEIAVAGEASVELGQATAQTVELIVDNAELAQKLERTLDVSKFGSPVKKVSTFRDRRTTNRVRLIAELSSPAIPTVVREGNTVRWRFASNDVARRSPSSKTMKTTNIPPTVVGGFGAASTPVAQQSVAQLPGAGNRRRTYYGQTVEFDFKDAPIHDLLRIIADTGGVNIVVPDTIDAKVTVRLKRVPWDQALEVILASHGLWYRREGNLFRIAPRKELDAEDEAEAARRAAMVASEAPKPEVVTLNYASADELMTKLDGMLSPKGKIEVDGRTNSLIINDVAGNRESIARLALQLDTETPQITIEARIVEAQSTYVRQFGIQWGGRALAGAAGGNATGLIFPSSIGIVGANTDNQTPDAGITALPSDFAINLPAATGTGEGGAIGMSLGSVGGNFNINLRLSALEDTGTVRIVSAPKITVLNNKAALIRSGVSIPISVVSAAGTQTQFVQADLKLEVTPYVSQRDCRIAMQLDVTKNEPDFVNVGARGDPTILRREAKTTMLVGDGETTVLGGIYTRNSGLAYKKVPFLGDLPVIGWLFKNRRENDNRTEILVFITPKITNKASLRCVQ
jgi:type IV pilus assembly protein PilQ